VLPDLQLAIVAERIRAPNSYQVLAAEDNPSFSLCSRTCSPSGDTSR